jgi:ParB/RepB/Spo0J family partition protein
MTDFKMIPVKEINPDKNQPRKFFDETAMKELTASVKEKGVLQPILVRLNGKENSYILVCGERRLRATKDAGLAEIPAVIRTLSDDEALELQIIENLQRKDVHPMEEAVAFKSLLENKERPHTMADIAAKVHKPEAYIAHRLAFNSLIPELQKDFWAGKFLVGHAVMFARLSIEDQKTCFKECRDHWNDNSYKSIKQVQDFISRNIMRILSSAPFKKDDATLNPSMGACTSCPFKSGNNPSLFDDVKEDDRCFKPSCFTVKMEEYTIRKIESILSEGDNIKLVSNGHDKILKKVVDLAKQYHVKILKTYDDFYSHNVGAGYSKAKGLWVNGNEVGQTADVYIKKSPTAASKGNSTPTDVASANIDDEIAGIKQRTKRAAELDDEKVWRRIHDEVIGDKALVNEKGLSKIDTAALLKAMHSKAGYSESDEIEKVFGTTDEKKLAEKFLNATPAQFNKVARIFIKASLDSATGSHSNNAGQRLLKMVGEQYHKDKIAAFELEQQEKRIKREERAAQRIKGLQDQKKQAPAKKAAPAGNSSTKKTAKKNAGKGTK